MPKPSDIMLIEFPYSHLSGGKRRPALVLSEPSRYGDILALAITSKPQHDHSFALTHADLIIGTLAKPSWVRYDQLHTFDKILIQGHIATLSSEAFSNVREHVCAYLGCHYGLRIS